jgi:uncharacterized membrane protein
MPQATTSGSTGFPPTCAGSLSGAAPHPTHAEEPMADLGNTSQAGTAHKHKMSSWITVIVLIVASIVLGFAFVMQSLPLAIVGLVLGVIGVVLGITGKIMDDAH